MPTTTDLRDGLAGLTALSAADLRRFWRQVDSGPAAREMLQDVLPLLIRTYGLAAATLSANWYDDVRDELGVAGRFIAVPATPKVGGIDVTARWAVAPMFQAEPDAMTALTRVEGAMQRRIADAGRNTVTMSSVGDPSAQGWQRQTAGGCSFCILLSSRGTVYRRETVDFASHDHCRCVAVPAFAGQPRPVTPYAPSEDIPDDDRARVDEYLRTHDAG